MEGQVTTTLKRPEKVVFGDGTVRATAYFAEKMDIFLIMCADQLEQAKNLRKEANKLKQIRHYAYRDQLEANSKIIDTFFEAELIENRVIKVLKGEESETEKL
jgi:alcohol dehydrogenase class IV